MSIREETVTVLTKAIQTATAGEVRGDIFEEMSFRSDLDIDSLTMAEISLIVEEKLGVRIPDEDLPGLVTVADAVNYIADRARYSGG